MQNDCKPRQPPYFTLSRFTTGIGIHTRNAVVENIENIKRFAYTALGDSINLATRLELLTKKYMVSIILSEPTYRQ